MKTFTNRFLEAIVTIRPTPRIPAANYTHDRLWLLDEAIAIRNTPVENRGEAINAARMRFETAWAMNDITLNEHHTYQSFIDGVVTSLESETLIAA